MRFQPKHFLTSPKTVFTLLFLLLCSIALSILIPQEFSTPPAQLALWQQTHPAWLPIIKRFDLSRLFTSPWFGSLLFLFLLSLTITTYDQFRISYQKMFGTHALLSQKTYLPPSAEQFEAKISAETLHTTLKQAGYRKLAERDDASRYVKHPWGYWGLTLLHWGLLITIGASLLLVATQKEGVLRLTEGITRTPDSPWLFEDHGLFAQSLRLPVAVRLDDFTPEFWNKGGIKSITSNLIFISPSGESTRLTTTTGSVLQHKGFQVYQKNTFGNNFHILLTDPAGSSGEIVLDMESPTTLSKASYGNFTFQEIPYHFKAKYFADAAGKALASSDPLLVVRLFSNQRLVDELSLQKGGHGTLGPYDVKLFKVTQWTDLIFWEKTGMPGIFLGIFIFSLGGLLYYFTIPRELYCEREADAYRFRWKCSRFKDHYLEEYRSIREHLQGIGLP